MTWLAVPILLAAAVPAARPAMPYQRVAATVHIIAAEEIRFEDIRAKASVVIRKATDRQTRNRGGMPLVEFH